MSARPSQACAGTHSPSGRHQALCENGYIVYRDADAHKATCQYCEKPIRRAHKRSAWWSLDGPAELSRVVRTSSAKGISIVVEGDDMHAVGALFGHALTIANRAVARAQSIDDACEFNGAKATIVVNPGSAT